jgi:hypothetical protein
VNLSTGGESKPAAAEVVSGTYFSVLGVGAALGRVFESDDDRTPGANPVVVLEYDFWKTQLGSAPDVVGRKVLLNQHPMTVIGVAAPVFRGIDVGEVPSLWVPAAMSAQIIPGFDGLLDRRTRWMQVLGRLRPGVTLAQAAGLQPWFKAMLDEDTQRAGFPRITADADSGFSPRASNSVRRHKAILLRRRLSQPLWVFAATAVLLGLACLNVAVISWRADRLATVRSAHGWPWRVARADRPATSDSVLLALAGGSLGVAFAPFHTDARVSCLATSRRTPAIRRRRALVALRLPGESGGGCSRATPALRRSVMSSSLGERYHIWRRQTSKIIVTVQIAFTLILVIGAALFVRMLTGLMAKGPGFATSSPCRGIDPVRSGYSPSKQSTDSPYS